MHNQITFERKLTDGWQVQAAQAVASTGQEISSPAYQTNNWHLTEAPSTVLATLVKNNVYQAPYFGVNLKDILADQFQMPWWYRKDFELLPEQAAQTVLIRFDGINYSANIWLNGQQIASRESVFGAFRRYILDVSKNVKAGKNVLAIEVFPPKPGDFSIGYVDWNPYPPDHNMGVFREVTLHFNHGVAIEHPFVDTKVDEKTFQSASLYPGAELVNYTSLSVSGLLKGQIEDRHFQIAITLAPGEHKSVRFNPEDHPALLFEKPKLWWPNNLGAPNLYQLNLSFEIGDKVSDKKSTAFGIRQVADYLNDSGHRGFKINGKKVLIKGAGWVDDLLLQDTPESLEAQIAYVKHMNLNCIRLEGIWGKSQKLYDLCDQYGILMMVGWSCHWEHEEYLGKAVHPQYGGVVTEEDRALIAQSWEDQLLWLRHHPSIFVWAVASDFLPHPELERKYVETFKKYDLSRPYLNSTGGVGSEQAIITSTEIVSEVSGSSGVKMLGPYAYTPPIYWYTDKNFGGAYGFNTETCPGANVPPLESIQKMIPEDHLWPIDEVWEFHCGKNAFSTLDRIQEAINARFGKAKGIADFAQKAQLLNYELMRPMFEAFQANKGMATGVIQWMLNSAFPEMYWQLYDSYLMPNGAFYATKKACEPMHLLYHYGDHAVFLVNDRFEAISSYRALIRLFDVHFQERFRQFATISVGGETSTHIIDLPLLEKISTTCFLDLRLFDDKDQELGNNFYWLSTKHDVLDYEAKLGGWAFYTPSKAYADFKQLTQLPKVKLSTFCHFKRVGPQIKAEIHLENPSNKIAFFIELKLCKGTSGESILPVFWEDNYISLLPGERRTLQATFAEKDLGDDQPIFKVEGINLDH